MASQARWWGTTSISLCLGAMLTPASALAQDQGPPPQAAEQDEDQTITVTAQKREESLQDVPISIDVVTGNTLDALHLNAATDLQYIVPGLSSPAQTGPRNFGFFVRGVGTTTFSSETIEPSTAFVVDGVVTGQPGAALVDLPAIERIEVLRGPQSTLFGKNASAGVINIITRRPSNTFELRAGVSWAGPDNDRHFYGYVSGPLGDTVRASLSGRRSVRDGYIDNLADGRELNNRNEFGFRGRVEWQPSSALRATLIADYWQTDSSCCIWTIERFGPAGFPGPVPPAYGFSDPAPGRENQIQNINGPLFTEASSYGVSLQLDWEIGGGHSLTSISAWRGFETLDGLDSDSTTDNFLDINFGDHDQDQISQELRISSPTGGFVDYVAGLYYFRQTVRSFTRQLFPTLTFLPFFNREVDVDVSTRNMAIFGQANFHLSDRLTATLGARLLDERQEVDKFRTDTITLATDSSTALGSDTALTWRAVLQYDFTPNVMAFASVTRGYKGGGFDSNIAIRELLSVGPERPTSYEAGLRAAFPRAGLTLNVTGFYADIRGYQTAARDSVTLTYPLNNGDARTRGIEAEATWRPIRNTNFNIVAGLVYTDAEWGDFPDAPCFAGQTLAEGCIGGAVQDLTGEPLPFAPKWAFNLGVDYSRPIGSNLSIGTTVNYNYRSQHMIGFPNAPDSLEPGYGLLSAAISLGNVEDRWRLSLFAKNLTDEHFRSYAFLSGGRTILMYRVYESRRIMGASLDVRF